MKRLLWCIPIILVCGGIGALIGAAAGKVWLGLAVGAVLPVAWMIVVFCFIMLVYGSLEKLLGK